MESEEVSILQHNMGSESAVLGGGWGCSLLGSQEGEESRHLEGVMGKEDTEVLC